jgi:hypothetical protein
MSGAEGAGGAACSPGSAKVATTDSPQAVQDSEVDAVAGKLSASILNEHDVAQWTTDDVAAWLRQENVREHVVKTLHAGGIQGRHLAHLTDEMVTQPVVERPPEGRRGCALRVEKGSGHPRRATGHGSRRTPWPGRAPGGRRARHAAPDRRAGGGPACSKWATVLILVCYRCQRQ